MATISWNEVRDRAIQFSRSWQAATSESADKQTFWNEFFNIFGRERRTVASFEVAVRNLQGRYNHIDLLWRGMLLVEHKSAGQNLDAAESQAFEYVGDLARDGRFAEMPRYVILSDFQRFALYDLEPDVREQLELFRGLQYTVTNFPLADLYRYVRLFAFVKGERTIRVNPEDPANEDAYDLMCRLHDELERGGFAGPDLERLLVRVLFCLFAEDTGVFEPNAFQSYIRNHTREDGDGLGAQLNELFDVLNTPVAERPRHLNEDLAAFPYVNGQLFAQRLGFAPFSRPMRDRLLEASDFQWARVSPAVFGSLFQGIMEDDDRRQQGAHYTSERDILKVIRSLFIDDLAAEFERIREDRSTRRRANLLAFHDKLRSLRFFDPACGCGNFLVLAYREVRQLELEVLRELHAAQQLLDVHGAIRVDVDQFYGIEMAEWPARIAEVALWLMDHQMNVRVSEAFGERFERLPLTSTPHIVQGNALRTPWRDVLPPGDGVYVFGNPPFVGKQFRTAEQQSDMAVVWGGVKGAGVLDYVTCWYQRAAEYIAGTNVQVAFVSTNSITQGEQVGILWNYLFRCSDPKIKISFAHRTFNWMSEARGRAHVHVVIIGFGLNPPAQRRLYDYSGDDVGGTVSTVPNISPYLIAGNDVVVMKRTRAISERPDLVFGSMPNDGGHLLLTSDQKNELLTVEPSAERYLRRIVGSTEFINGVERWCLWLTTASPADLRRMPEVMRRVEGVRAHREASPRETTNDLAQTPTLFGEIRQPASEYLLIPGASSESRRYIPMALVSPDVVASNLVYALEGSTLWEFGLLTSAMHMAWVSTVCGRLKSDYRYSNHLVYNNFPWPRDVEEGRRTAVERAAQRVIDERAPFLPPQGENTYADLYDPLTMPAPLARAHADLDRAVDRCYRTEPFRTDRERVEHLFAQYEAIVGPLLPAAGTRRRRRVLDPNQDMGA